MFADTVEKKDIKPIINLFVTKTGSRFVTKPETVSIFIKLSWIPKFPFVYAKKYFNNLIAPNNSPLSGVRNEIKDQLK